MIDTERLLKQLEKAQLENDFESQANILSGLGNAYIMGESPKQAIPFYKQALGIVHQLNNRQLEEDILSNLGSAFDKVGETTHAIEAYEQALQIARDEERLLLMSKKVELDKESTEDNLGYVGSEISAIINTSDDNKQLRKKNIRLKNTRNIAVSLIIIIVISFSAYFLINIYPSLKNQGCSMSEDNSQNSICAFQATNGEYIGLSYGQFAFDTRQIGGDLKRQASTQFSAGDTADAVSTWQEVIKLNPNDAEALIYLEDQQVFKSNRPYITLVITTMLSGDDTSLSIGRDNLQGAYTAQKEYNDQNSRKGLQICLLVANIGGQSLYADTIANYIVGAASADRRIVGVLGFPILTNHSIDKAVKRLAQAHIPIISQSPSVDQSSATPFLFSIVPSAERESIAGTQYAENTLHAETAAIFYDPTDLYSSSLEAGFEKQFVADGKKLVAKVTYTIGQPETLLDLLRPVLLVNPDVIYFAGSASDVNVLINNINGLENNVSFTKPQIIGGSSLDRVTQFPGSAPASFNILHITVPVYHDVWNNPQFKDQDPPFFNEYSQIFGPGFPHGIPSYLPDKDIMLSYDSTLVLLKGIEMVMTRDNSNFTAEDLGKVLATITNSYAIQGVSGQISFEPNGEPSNKAIEVLSFGTDGMIQVSSMFGNFLR